MVITQKQFNEAMTEVNEAFAKVNARLDGANKKIAALEDAAKPAPAKRVAKAKE